jgi:outer membrane murein-binding lipoprotein Lpp
MTRSLVCSALVLGCVLLGCPKNVVTNVAGTDDEKMDQLSAQLEELHTKTDLPCGEYCSLKSRACGVSTQACEVSTRAPERADFQKKCVVAQEECARFNEACDRCSK